MLGSISAELLKLRKRRATWVLGAILLLCLVLFDYALGYVVAVNRPPNITVSGGVPDLTATLLPAHLISSVLSLLTLLGGALVLILGALAMGSEYEWGTLKTILTQRPGRLTVFWGKVLAAGVILVVFVLLVFIAAAVSSVIIAHLAHLAHRKMLWPTPFAVVRGIGAAWLILAMWTALGVVLAVLFQGTALAVGLGLVYVLVVENVIGGFSSVSAIVGAVYTAMPGRNANALASAFAATRPGQGPAESAAQAAAVLAVYALGFLLLGALLIRQRDVP